MKRALTLFVVLFLAACGSISGTWVGTEGTQGGYAMSTSNQQATATLNASGSTITGTFTSGILRATGMVNGAYNGNQITSFTITFQNGSCSTVTGSGTLNGNLMTLTLAGCGLSETVQLQKQ